jgi:hypothetical protein
MKSPLPQPPLQSLPLTFSCAIEPWYNRYTDGFCTALITIVIFCSIVNGSSFDLLPCSLHVDITVQAHGAFNTAQEINGTSHAATDHCYIYVDWLLTQFKSLPQKVKLTNGNYLFLKN